MIESWNLDGDPVADIEAAVERVRRRCDAYCCYRYPPGRPCTCGAGKLQPGVVTERQAQVLVELGAALASRARG